LILEKGTELGATALHPVYTERSVRKLTPLKSRWQRVVQAAARQCDAAYLPELWEPVSFESFLALPFDGLRLLATPKAGARLVDLLPANPPSRVLALTGPEGGFSEAELSAAHAAGFDFWDLGSQILRAETAPFVALTILRHTLSDLG
jgi:16S rRNA (uracil1498-N3)-methyltransferase